MNQDGLRHLLLDLLSTRQGIAQATLDALSDADWQFLTAMASEHRLLPILHWRLGHERRDLRVDPSLRDTLREATQQATMRALKVQGELLRVVRLLDACGIPNLALKGAYLAYEVYPQPAMRPMRDLDVLVAPEHALEANAALRAAGFVVPKWIDGDAEVCLVERKHLPPLVAPASGVHVEIHARLTRTDEGHPDKLQLVDLWERRVVRDVGGQSVACLSPTDLLLHLIYHAAYDHRLDNGPLTLTDLAYLIRCMPIDWPRFWAQARDGGWVRGSLLLLMMTQHYFDDLTISFAGISQEYLAAAKRFAEASATLTLRHKDDPYVHIAASLVGRSRPRQLLILASRLIPSHTTLATCNPGMASVGGTARAYGAKIRRMLTYRLPNLVRDLRRTSLHQEVRQAVELERWLTQP